MELHKSFIRAEKELKIRIVFMNYDIFSICHEVTMFWNGRNGESISDCSVCGFCNMTALSMKKIIVLQSNIYRWLKDTKLIRCLRK